MGEEQRWERHGRLTGPKCLTLQGWGLDPLRRKFFREAPGFYSAPAALTAVAGAGWRRDAATTATIRKAALLGYTSQRSAALRRETNGSAVGRNSWAT